MRAFLFLTILAAWSSQNPATVDPRYKDAVAKMARTLETLPAYRVDVAVVWKSDDGQEGTNAFVFLLDRGGKYRIEVRPGGKPETSLLVVNDGKAVTMFLPKRKLYTQGPAIDPAEAMESVPLLAESLKGSLIDSLVKPGLNDFILERTRRASFVGTDMMDGRKIDHFRLTWGRDEEEIWIGPETEALPRKLIRVAEFPGKDAKIMKLTTTTMLKWTLARPNQPSDFTIDLPKDAKKVADLEAALIDASGNK